MNICRDLQEERDRLVTMIDAIDKAIAALLPFYGGKHAPPPPVPEPATNGSLPSARSRSGGAKSTREKNRRTPKPPASGEELTYAEAAKLFPFTANSISQLKVTKRITGGRGTVHRSSLENYMRQRGHAKKKAAPTQPRKKPDRGSYKIKPGTDTKRPWLNGKSSAADMKPHEWIADQLKITESEVHEIIKAGGIHGGDHVANWEQLRAYMAHPSYQENEPVEA